MMKDYKIRKAHANDVHNLGGFFVEQIDNGTVVGKGFETKDEARAHIRELIKSDTQPDIVRA